MPKARKKKDIPIKLAEGTKVLAEMEDITITLKLNKSLKLGHKSILAI